MHNTRRGRKPHEENHLVVGRKPVRELLRHSAARVVGLSVTEEARVWIEGECGRQALAKIPVKVQSNREIEAVVGNEIASHQGCIAFTQPREIEGMAELSAALKHAPQNSLLWVLAGVTDVRNFAAILRVASCFGALGVVIPKNRSVRVSPAVSRVSAGASEFVPIYTVPNISQMLARAQEFGFAAVATTCGVNAVPLHEAKLPARAAVVLGAEGDGIPPLIVSRCDSEVVIPMSGVVESLNVAQAASVIGWHWRMQHG